jgi:hypothetical protein
MEYSREASEAKEINGYVSGTNNETYSNGQAFTANLQRVHCLADWRGKTAMQEETRAQCIVSIASTDPKEEAGGRSSCQSLTEGRLDGAPDGSDDGL